MVDKATKKPNVPKRVRLAWSTGDHLDPVLVDHMILQTINDNLYVTFGQIRPFEAVAGSSEPVAEIRPVTRIILSKGAAKRIATVLIKHAEDQESK